MLSEALKREIAGLRDDKSCSSRDCEAKSESLYCDTCKKERAYYFKYQYYLKMGWDTSKIAKEFLNV